MTLSGFVAIEVESFYALGGEGEQGEERYINI